MKFRFVIRGPVQAFDYIASDEASAATFIASVRATPHYLITQVYDADTGAPLSIGTVEAFAAARRDSN